MSTLKEFVICPYNRNHILSRYKVQNHIPSCKEQYQNVFSLTCRFNCQRLCEEDTEFLPEADPENRSAGSKSKRRRLKIKERHARKILNPRICEKPRRSYFFQKALDMENQQFRGPWEESVKKKSSKKNSSRVSNSKAKPAQDDAIQPSKSAIKRAQKKLRKERGIAKANSGTAKKGSGDKLSERKEYVIKLGDNVTVTETNRPHKEVFFHYPTRKIVSAGSAPKSGLGIQPRMLQKLCFDTFMKLRGFSDEEGEEEGNGIASSVNEDENRTIEDSDEIACALPPLSYYERRYDYDYDEDEEEIKTLANYITSRCGITPSVNVDEDPDPEKTLLSLCETARRRKVPPSIINKENKTSPAPEQKPIVPVQSSKRSKSKKNKKKSDGSQKTAAPSSEDMGTSSGLRHRDHYAKYMTPSPNPWPLPRPTRPDPNSFPSPYLVFEEYFFKRGFEGFMNPTEYEDFKIDENLDDDEQAYENENICDDEQAHEKENMCDEQGNENGNQASDENENANAKNELKDEEANKTEDLSKDENNSVNNSNSPEEEQNGKIE